MLATLTAALSLAASLSDPRAMNVPFLAQTEALCGGAAAAMVFRYWGDLHADVQEFAPLVDRRAGGIANGVLADAVRARGWRVDQIEVPGGAPEVPGTVDAVTALDALKARVRMGQPVIVLVPDRGFRYHYVVVTGSSSEAIVVHDPSWGPSRLIPEKDFARAWRAAEYWSLVILPPARAVSEPARLEPAPVKEVEAVPAPIAGPCEARLDRALAEIRARGFDHADALLGQVRAECPDAAGPLRELSGVRFAQRRWQDAAALARAAIAREPHDAYALDVLGSSLFMQDDAVGALRAWNQIGKPKVDLVRIDGVRHTRHQTIVEALGIHPNMLLKAEMFERARRRLDELPDQSTARLAVRPGSDGFADVDVVVAERAMIPRGAAAWVGAGVRAGIDREVGVTVPGVTGQGEVWSARWRWWNERPGVSIGFAAPRPRGLPGVWRVDGSWAVETFAPGETRISSSHLRESRTRASLAFSDWLTGSVKYGLTAGFDAWDSSDSYGASDSLDSGRKAASVGASVDRRLFSDRVSVAGDVSRWWPLTSGTAFHSMSARITARSSRSHSSQGDARRWVARGTAGWERVSDAAPFGLWPGAGEGRARAPLLRAHPLLDEGIVDLAGASAFGRSLTFASAEIQRWFERPTLIRIGLAGFADSARASRRAFSSGDTAHVDVGVGVRARIPGSPGVLRVDVAHGLRDGGNALTVGWLF
jgi:hypothetical protein